MSITVAMRTEISQLYVSLFGRAPDGEGLGFWVSSYSKGNTLANIAQSMYDTAPARAYYPLFATPSEIVTTFYTNVLGRAPDAEGLAFWVKEYSAAATQGAFFSKLISNVVNYSGTDAAGLTSKSLFTNKVSVAQYYGELNGSVAGATAALSGVTSVAASVDTAKAVILAGGVTPGQTFTLTTSADNLTGTTGDDAFFANLDFSIAEAVTTSSAYSIADSIDAKGGTDTLNLTITGAQDAAVTIPGPSLLGVETIKVRNTVAQTASLDANFAPGLTTFTADRSIGAATVTNLAVGGNGTVIGDAVNTMGAFNLGYVAAATTGTLNFTNGTLGTPTNTVSGTGLTSMTVNSSGAANVTGNVTLAATTTALTINASSNLTVSDIDNTTAAALTSLTVTGAGNVNTGSGLDSTVTTVNASALTGNLTTVLGSAVTQTVTGGTGNDIITTGAVLTTGSVNAGAGTDVLVLASATHLASTTLSAKYTNFETLRLATGVTMDMANAPAGTVALQTAGVATATNMSATQAGAVSMVTNAIAGTADALTFALASASGTADVLTITAGTGLTTTGALDIAALDVTGFETLNLRANPGPTSTAGGGTTAAGDRTTFVTGTITGASLGSIVLTGTAVNIANVAISGRSAAVNINGSALTGDGLAAASQAGLTVSGSAYVGSTITGSGVRDVFTIGAEGSTYDGGAGNDRMTTTVALLLADGSNDGTFVGGLGTDTMAVSDTTTPTLIDSHFLKMSGFEALSLVGTGDSSITTGGGFNAAFATGATITTGTLAANTDFTLAAGLSTVPITLTVTATSLVGTAVEVHSLVTGSANDSVTFTGDDTYVGVVTDTQGTVTIDTRAGDDTISFTHGQLLAAGTGQAFTIIGGAGADTITKGAGSLNRTTALSTTVFTMAAGDSGTTAATMDKISNFQTAGISTNYLSDVLNFEGTASVSAFSSSIDFGTIASHSITSGIATFDTAATFGSAKIVNPTNLADVVGYLNANLAVNGTAGFLYDSNGDGSNDATIVYHQGSSLTTVADDMVQLTGVQATSLTSTLTTATALGVAIA
jgi:hypothetical protein